MQSQRINLVRNAIKIQTTREEKISLALRKKSVFKKRKSVLDKYNVLTKNTVFHLMKFKLAFSFLMPGH